MLKDIIEAIIFASGNGISRNRIIEGLKDSYSQEEINDGINLLIEQKTEDSGIILIQSDGVIQFQSNPRYGDILSDILLETREREISKTLLQVLAIIAYKQPVTKSEIEELRGINSDYVISMLLKLDLIDAVGRKETIGRPILYGTTREFLRKFGLESLSEMPDYDDLMHKIKNNFERYYAKTSDLYRDSSKELKDISNIDNSNVQNEGLPEFLKNEDIVEID